MRKVYFSIMVLSFLFLVNDQIARAQNDPADTKVTSEVSKPIEVGNNICPVTGEKIDEKTKATYEYEGKIYNFCCTMCIDDFKKDPQKYIKKIEDEKNSTSTKETPDMRMVPKADSSY
jgi:YHS domain-containing protein